mgnify:CR=1 FL=1
MTCGKCGKRSNCKEICKEVEALLPKPRSGGHRKESLQSSDYLDLLPNTLKLNGVDRPSMFGTHKKDGYNVPLQRKPELE